jgi:hypothetical protein
MHTEDARPVSLTEALRRNRELEHECQRLRDHNRELEERDARTRKAMADAWQFTRLLMRTGRSSHG